MTKTEEKYLWACVKRMEKASARVNKACNKKFKNAGHSGPGGTGDEGWMRVHSLSGQAVGLMEAALELSETIVKMKGL